MNAAHNVGNECNCTRRKKGVGTNTEDRKDASMRTGRRLTDYGV